MMHTTPNLRYPNHLTILPCKVLPNEKFDETDLRALVCLESCIDTA